MKDNRGMGFDLTVKVEGGYFNDPLGGPTKFGVTLATAKKLGFDMDNDGDVDETDIKLLTVEEARQAFFKLYWDEINADALPDGLDIMAADLAYNSGPGRVAKLYDPDFYRFTYNRQRYFNALNKTPKYQWAFGGWCNRLEILTAAIEAKWPDIAKHHAEAKAQNLDEIRALAIRMATAIEALT